MTCDPQKRIFTIPNVLSMLRLCMIPFIVWFYLGKGDNRTTGILLIISGITDQVDGFIARRFNMITDVGKVLDPVADKLTQATVLFCLAMRFPLMFIPLALMVVKEIFMLISGYLVFKKNSTVYGARWHGKVATALLYGTMIVHVFWEKIPRTVSTSLILLSTIMIFVSMIFYLRQNHALLRTSES